MAKKIMLAHTQSGVTKKAYFGYSWTYFLFGPFVPLFRGESLRALVYFIILYPIYTVYGVCMFWPWVLFGGKSNFIIATVVFASPFFLIQAIIAFRYNKGYTVRLMETGYTIKDSNADRVKQAKAKLGIHS